MSNFDKIEYYKITQEIINHPEYKKRKEYAHHGDVTVYDHSISVSKLGYKIAKKLKCDYKSVAISGLLHDFYLEPWQTSKEKKPFFKRHGFVHAKEAYDNSIKYFPEYMDNKTLNSILRHMFPLNKIPPKYLEGWIITVADKIVSTEVILNPSFFKYLVGFRK